MSLHQLNEIIMEAMIILDPPWLPKDTRSPSSLTSQQIAQALELLLSSSHLTDIKETDEPPQRSNDDNNDNDDDEGGDHPMNGECHDRNNKDGTRQTISSVVEYSSKPTKHDSSTLQPSITDRKRKSSHSIYNTTSRNSTTESSHHNKSLKMLTPTHHPVALLTCFADYYRSVIVCCSLLLELCPDEQYDDNLYNTPISTNPNHDNNDRSNVNMNNNSTTINPKNTKDHQQQQQQTFIPKVESLLKTIRQSILLLQRLAYSNHHNYFSSSISIHSNNMTTQEEPLQNKSITSSRYNSHYKQTQPLQQQHQHQHQLDIDWHDDYLPSSQYPLLQECFQRIELMNVQDGIVFGRDDRLVSLDCRDYYLNGYYHGYYHGGKNIDDGVADRSDCPDDDGNVRMNDEHCLGANNDDDGRHPNENDGAGGGPMETSTDLALFCMDSKAIASEADELFDIALPTTSSNNHRRKTLNPDKQQLSSISSRPTLPNSSIRQSKEEGWYPFIQNPFTGQTFPICKEGWLCMLSITLSNGHPSPTPQSCYIQLLTNNVLILTSSLPPNDGDEVKTNADRHKTNDLSNIDASPSINVITLTNACRCIPKVQKQQFQFHLENVYLLHSSAAAVEASPQHCNIEFGVDEMRGGSYLDGYSWVTTLTDAVKKFANLNDIQSLIYKEWSNGDGAKVKNDYLQAKSCVM